MYLKSSWFTPATFAKLRKTMEYTKFSPRGNLENVGPGLSEYKTTSGPRSL